MPKKGNAIGGKILGDGWVNSWQGWSLAERKEALKNLIKTSETSEPIVTTLLNEFSDSTPELRSLISDYFLHLAAQFKNLKSQTETLSEDLAKTKLVLENEIPKAVEHEKALAARTSELEALQKEFDAFIYIASHELRSPLRHIEGFIGIIKVMITSPPEISNHLDALEAGAKRMGEMFDSLLILSRTCRAELNKVPLDLSDLVKSVPGELAPQTANREIEWRISSLPCVNADASLLRQVLMHLIQNALKFTRGRKPAKIEIGSVCEQTEHIIFVRDNGVGFDPGSATRLFSPFRRLHRRSDFEGHGIGLACVRRIINRHGGRAWADGEPDQGATFYFSLPS